MEIYDDNYVVYIHINKVNGKMYVGITSQIPEIRWGYKGMGYLHCPKMWNAIQKYGWDNFEHVIFATRLTQDEACNMERILIQQLQTTNDKFGYNIDAGGLAAKHTAETIEKIRQANVNKKVSEETKEKLRQARKKQVLSKEHLEAFIWNFKGKNHTDEAKHKIKEAHRKDFKAVLCIETNVIYESITEASRQTGTAKSTISTICNQKLDQRTAGGYHWRFVA